MAGHNGPINTSFYFGFTQESESSIVLGHGGAAFCVHRPLQGRYGATSPDPCFAVTLAALLKVIKQTSENIQLLYGA